MLTALKSQLVRAQTFLASPSPYNIFPKVSVTSFGKAVERAQHHQPQNFKFSTMAQAPQENLEVGDSLASLGQVYATRCEEEGYGGIIYGLDKYTSEEEEENIAHDDHAKSLGSEVKEEKKDGDQKKVPA